VQSLFWVQRAAQTLLTQVAPAAPMSVPVWQHWPAPAVQAPPGAMHVDPPPLLFAPLLLFAPPLLLPPGAPLPLPLPLLAPLLLEVLAAPLLLLPLQSQLP
jgi:hypothetical protein